MSYLGIHLASKFRFASFSRKESYDGIVHPQKRILLKDGVTAVMGRLIEIKNVRCV